MDKFHLFIKYTNNLLKKSNLQLSEFGIEEMRKRWQKPSDNGGYTNYWKTIEPYRDLV